MAADTAERTIFVTESCHFNVINALRYLIKQDNWRRSQEMGLCAVKSLVSVSIDDRVVIQVGPDASRKIYRVIHVVPLLIIRDGDEGGILVGTEPVKVCRNVIRYVFVEPE